VAALVALAVLTGSAAAAASRTATAARVGNASPNAQLQLVLPLKAKLSGLRRFALAVSTPGNALYGHYESIAQLAARFGASRRAETSTMEFLHHAGATRIKLDATGLFVDATLRAATAERLFVTPLAEFRSGRETYTAPTGNPAMPAALRGFVTGVVGLDTRPVAVAPSVQINHNIRTKLAAEPNRSAAAAFTPFSHTDATVGTGYFPATGTQSGCAAAETTTSFTPNQYLTAYNYAPMQAAGLTGAGETMALIEIDGYKLSDIQTFASCFGLGLPPIKNFGVGISRALPPGTETTLDLEVMAAAAPGLKQIDVYESQANEADSLRALTSPLQNKGYKPDVISASLGLCERDVAGVVGESGLNNTEGALEEAAAAGISFLDASGDSGSADCQNENDQPIDQLDINYPTSSWWVTGVGGTNVELTPSNTLAAQVVWNDGNEQPGSAGGGGQSGIFRRPPYQTGTVPVNRREVPDVSMLADIAPGYAIYCSVASQCVSSKQPDPWMGVGGTSAATPLLAGGFAMVDQDLAAHAHQNLGFANPLLYDLGRSPAAPAVFSNVTEGSNDIGPFISANGAPLGCCTAGAGYSDAAGWGSVNLTGFAASALAAPPELPSVSVAVPAQKPIAAHGISTTVTCSEACSFGAVAVIKIGKAKAIDVSSKALTLAAAGSQAAPITFGKKVESKLKAGARQHKRITAKVNGVALDILGRIEVRSNTVKLVLKG
jgi:subtilase family serine protease